MRASRRDRRIAAAPGLAQTAAMNAGSLAWAALAALVLLAAAWVGGRGLRRARARGIAIRGVLDAADRLEARLRSARDEIEAVAGSEENPVRGAMRDLLRQRLWLQEHAQDASLAQLEAVRDALESASGRLEFQLQRVRRARAAAEAGTA